MSHMSFRNVPSNSIGGPVNRDNILYLGET